MPIRKSPTRKRKQARPRTPGRTIRIAKTDAGDGIALKTVLFVAAAAGGAVLAIYHGEQVLALLRETWSGLRTDMLRLVK